MNEHEFKIFKQPFTEDGTLVVIQTGSLENFDVKTYNIREVVDLLNELVTKCNQLEMEKDDLEKEKEGWKLSTCQYMNKDSVLMMDCQIVHEALFELERLIEADTEQMERFNDLKDKFKGLVNHYLGVFNDE